MKSLHNNNRNNKSTKRKKKKLFDYLKRLYNLEDVCTN
jgi:hypothetical protein